MLADCGKAAGKPSPAGGGTRPWGSLTCSLGGGPDSAARRPRCVEKTGFPGRGQTECSGAFDSPMFSGPRTRPLCGETGYSKFLVFWQELIILMMSILYLGCRA